MTKKPAAVTSSAPGRLSRRHAPDVERNAVTAARRRHDAEAEGRGVEKEVLYLVEEDRRSEGTASVGVAHVLLHLGVERALFGNALRRGDGVIPIGALHGLNGRQLGGESPAHRRRDRIAPPGCGVARQHQGGRKEPRNAHEDLRHRGPCPLERWCHRSHESRSEDAGTEPFANDVETHPDAAPPVGHRAGEKFLELVAVAGPPVLRIPAQEPRHPDGGAGIVGACTLLEAAPFFGFTRRGHEKDHPAARRCRPASTTWR